MSEVIDVKQSGDYYTVRGAANGKPVSVDIPSSYVAGKSEKETRALFERSVQRVADAGAK